MPTYSDGTLTWNYTLSGTSPNQVASIGSGLGNTGSATTAGTGLTGAIIVPSTVDGYTVIAIWEYAFAYCGTGLTSITIPETVVTIGNNAFFSCIGLTSFTIPNLVTAIGSQVFQSCSGLTSFTMGNSVTTIGHQAFANCAGLTSFTIPDSVVTIENSSVFYGCTGFTSFTMGNSVTTIGNTAFEACTGLTSFTMGNSVTTIGTNIFYNGNPDLIVTMNTKTINGTTYISPTTTDIAFFGNTSVTLVLPPPSPAFVTGKVPNWLQPKSGQYATMGGYESQFLAWCSPTSAANQLGHLVDHGGVTQPTNINDGTDAGNNSPFALATSTIAWDSGYGWGDYMLDGPTYRGKNLFNGVVSDFGWHMNTNNLGPLGASAGSAAGSTLQNIYNGMTDFYQQVGYTNMVGMVYHFSNSIQTFGPDPAYWTANGHTAGAGVSADYAITLATIKHEIDNNRTVMACFNGWSITPAGHAELTGMTSTEDETGTYQTIGEYEPVGPHGEQFNIASTEGEQANVESYNAGLGHTVLIVGYIPAGAAQDPTGTTNWLVVRDNFTTTHKNVFIPFADLSKLLATVYVNHTTATYSAVTVGGTDYEGTTVTFSTNTLTIENSIDENDTDLVSFVLPAGYEMADMSVTNFVGTGTITYTVATGGSTVTSGTFTAVGTNLLAGNPLIASAGADITYTLTFSAGTAITYTIEGTKTVDYGVIVYSTPDWSTLVERTLTPSTEITGSRFGAVMAMSGNYAIIGAYIDNKAYIYEKNGGVGGWSVVSVLESSYSVNNFGYSVSIDGDYAIVGALTTAGPGTSPGYTYGSAHIFKRDNSGAWNEEVMFQPTDKLVGSNGYTRFGFSVAIEGDYACIGATNNKFYTTTGGSAFGSAHVYKRDGAGNWTSFNDLISFNDDSTFTNRTGGNVVFGITIALQGDELFIGSGGTINQGGSVLRIFKMNSGGTAFEPSQYISPQDDGFSKYGLAVNGDYMIVGAVLDDHNNNAIIDTGAAYIYLRNGSGVWNQQKHLYGQDPETNDMFGWSVAIHGDFAMVGAKWKNSPSVGAAFVYERNGTNWTQIQYILGTGDEFGASVAMDGDAWLVGRTDGGDSGMVYSYEPTIEILFNPTPLLFTGDILTMENSIDTTDTDPVSFVLPAGYEMADMSVTNFVGTGTITYTVATGGSTVTSGTFTAVGTNLLAGNPLIASAHTTYTLTLIADAAITYTIEGTKKADYGTSVTTTDFTTLTETFLKASDVSGGDNFGESVSISGSYAIVGAHLQDSSGVDSGAAYIYERTVDGSWNQVPTILKASNVSGGDNFGNSVSISGSYAIVGAPLEDSSSIDQTGSTDSGAAYIFERATNGIWNQVPTILKATITTAPDYDKFGSSVAIDANYAIIGAPIESTTFYGSGAAYIFERTVDGSWNQVPTIIKASNASASAEFGNSVSISGNYAIVGAAFESTGGLRTGEAYIFERDTDGSWNETHSLKASNAGDGVQETFGNSVSISGNYAIVGAPYEDSVADNMGAAYIFERDTDGSWNQYSTIIKPINANGTDYVGAGVAIDGNYAIIGAHGQDTSGPNTGEAYVFERDTDGSWNEIKSVKASNAGEDGPYAQFGKSVSISGSYIIVGAFRQGTDGLDSGAAYIYESANVVTINPTNLTFSNNVFTIENSINSSDTDVVDFVLPVGDEMHQLVVTNYAGTGAINYEITTGETSVKTGTILENSAIGTNLLDGTALTSAIGSTYQLTLTATAGANTYTIVGTKAIDYSGEPGTPTTLVFSNNVLTIDNVTSTTDTDVIDFVLPVGYNIPALNVTNFNVSGGGSGNVSYTLATGGNTIVSGTFSALSSNILLSGFPIFAPSTDITYSLTITADVTIGYTIVGTRSVTNLSNFSITQLLGSGFTEQQLIDAGKWNADSNANSFDPTYINGFVDVSGNLTVTDNILMDSGDIDLHSFTYTDPYVFTADVVVNTQLFVVGDVSMGDASLNVVGDMSINGKMSVGSYKPASISGAAIIPGSGYSTSGTTTTFTEDIAYDKKIQFNGDISLNLHHVQDFNEPNVFVSTDAKTTTPQKWQDIEISSTGQYQIAVVGGYSLSTGNIATAVTGNVWISTDYGETWLEKTGIDQVSGSEQSWINACISADGAVMMVKAMGNIVYRSENGGVSWTQKTITNFTERVSTGWDGRPYYNLLMASDGQRVIIGTFNNDQTKMMISTDGGTNWADLTSLSSEYEYIIDYHMSKSGKYILVMFNNSTRPKYSDDFGATFITITDTNLSLTLSTNYVMHIYSRGVCAISDNGYAILSDYNSPINTINLTTGTVSNNAYDGTWVAHTSSGVPWAVCISKNGKYMIVHLRQNGTYVNSMYISSDYGTTFTVADSTVFYVGYKQVTFNSIALNSRCFATRFSDDNKYIAAIQEGDHIYVHDANPLVANPNSTTYFGPNTTLKANTGIEFPDNTTLHSSNKESNGTTFKASTFNNMTVIGDFASNPLLTPSDYRIKTNVETLDETHTVDNLRPVKYKQTQTGKNDIGFLAHELQEHYPELVEGEKDGETMQSVNYSGLLPVLINEVQQLKKQIAETRARIQTETP